jgi:hypothetical protein
MILVGVGRPCWPSSCWAPLAAGPRRGGRGPHRLRGRRTPPVPAAPTLAHPSLTGPQPIAFNQPASSPGIAPRTVPTMNAATPHHS